MSCRRSSLLRLSACFGILRIVQLQAFRVTNFRNAIDSSEVPVEPGVTCLVGKNESGKTAMLQALYRIKPVYPASFEAGKHYPRQRLVRDRRAGKIDGSAAIAATFALSDDDRELIEKHYGKGVLPSGTIELRRGYDFQRTYLTVHESAAVSAVLDRILEADAPLRSRLAADITLAELQKAMTEDVASADALPEDQRPDVQHQRDLLLELQGLDTEQRLRDAVWGLLEPRVPEFFYFSDYSYLPGRIDVSDIATDPNQPAADAMQTARALLKLAGTTVEELSGDDYESSKAELEAVSNDLTRQLQDYWHQGGDLELNVEVERENRTGPRGERSVATFLNVRVRDRQHGFSNNFDERSSGFRWFFSFLAAFSEFEELDRPVIILLDEPALTLHGKAQADFLRFIDERLAPAGQVLYTTHSPFMVQPGALPAVRIVEDKGADEGSVTSSDVLSVDRDSLFPLQGALGFEVAQSLFIGPDNILVEGTSDWTYLTVMSDHLRELGRENLDENWKILPTGGAQNIPAFVALLGGHLDVTVLVDSGTKGMQRLDHLVTERLLASSRLVKLGDVLGTATADIEDVFARGDYLKLYNAAFDKSLNVEELQPRERILRAIAATEGVDDFAHGKPADALLRDRATFLAELSEETLERFEKLFERLNSTRPA